LPHNSSANHHNLYLAIRHTHPKETMPENHKRTNAKTLAPMNTIVTGRHAGERQNALIDASGILDCSGDLARAM